MVTSIVVNPRGRVTTRTNRIQNPQLAAGTTDWTAGAGTGGAGTAARALLSLTVSYYLQFTFTAAPTGFGSSIYNFALGKTPVSAGSSYYARINGYVTWAGAQTVARIYFYSAAGAIVGAATGSATVHAAGASEWREVTGVAPAGAAYARVDFAHFAGSMPVVGSKIAASAALFQAQAAATSYFDGSTAPGGGFYYSWTGAANASPSIEQIDDPATLVYPDLVLGYEASRRSRNVVHDILSSSDPVITLHPAAPRNGTLQLFFIDRGPAFTALSVLSRVGTFALTDTDVPEIAMTAAVVDTATIALDEDTREHWVVSVPYQELTA